MCNTHNLTITSLGDSQIDALVRARVGSAMREALTESLSPQMIRIKEETAVHAVDWHPAHATILASGRAARAHAPAGIKVWDTAGLSSDGPHQPIAIIQTMDGISNIMWRPTYRTHLATSYMTHLAAVHVWDLPQYWSPLAVCKEHTLPVTDVLWQDAHVLSNPNQNSDDVCWMLTCAKDGTIRCRTQRRSTQAKHLRPDAR